MNWNDITLRQWNQIETVYNKQYEDDILQTADIISVLFDIENPMELTPQEFSSYVEKLSFLKDPIPDKRLCNTYNINGTTYNFEGNIYQINTAQFYDYRKISVKQPIDYAECLSVFMIPEGHKYNDGYNMDKTIEDMNCLPLPDVMKLFTFFRSALYLSLHITQNYLVKHLKKTNLTKNQIKEIKDKMKEMEEISGTFYLTY